MRVMYVVGLGHSGSTILDTVLGNHPKMESFGELSELDRAWLTGTRCACRNTAPTCPFWIAVHREWADRLGRDPAEGHHALRHTFERLHSWPRLMLAQRRPGAAFQRYARSTRALFESIQELTNADVMVDSSKMPGRAFALSIVPGIELYLIHLVRDPRGVAWSMQKVRERDRELRRGAARSLWFTVFYWWLVNRVAEHVSRRLPPDRVLFLRYEDFVGAPDRALDRIGRMVGLDMTELKAAVADRRPMAVKHTIEGNRLRFANQVRLRGEDREWTTCLSPGRRGVVETLLASRMRRYGYAGGAGPVGQVGQAGTDR